MNVSKIAVGKNPPWDVNVIIEIPAGGAPIKYELDKESGTLFVDRFLHTAMFYPANYGFIPHTVSKDGDPMDALVLTRVPLMPGSVIQCRPLGVLMMEDEAGGDEKLIMVPVSSIDPYYDTTNTTEDIPLALRNQIEHFFEHYKDLEKNKWVKIDTWKSAKDAALMIEAGIQAFKDSFVA